MDNILESYQLIINSYVNETLDSLEQKHIDIFKSLEENSLKCLHKDEYTYEHNLRVKEYCLMMGTKLNLDSDDIDNLGVAAEYHDIGKIEINDNVLLKKDILTNEEFENIKKHTQYGYELMKMLVNEQIALGIKHHHERLDGSGYPDGLKNDEINIYAKIIAIADSYDAMTTDRPYHSGMNTNEAYNEIYKNRGKLFEEEYIEALKEVLIEMGLL